MKNLCKTCLGAYDTLLSDGLEYYHACAPIAVSETESEERIDKRDENIGKKLEGKGADIIVL